MVWWTFCRVILLAFYIIYQTRVVAQVESSFYFLLFIFWLCFWWLLACSFMFFFFFFFFWHRYSLRVIAATTISRQLSLSCTKSFQFSTPRSFKFSSTHQLLQFPVTSPLANLLWLYQIIVGRFSPKLYFRKSPVFLPLHSSLRFSAPSLCSTNRKLTLISSIIANNNTYAKNKIIRIINLG